MFEVSEAVTVEGVAHVLRSALNEAPGTVMTLAERLRAEGRNQGLQQGLQQKARELLLRLIERRFGDVPDAIAARIASAPLDDLDRWADQFATAVTLDEVFAKNG